MVKKETSLDKIEKLIVDGNKEVLDRLVRLETGQQELFAGQQELRAGQQELRAGQQELSGKFDHLDRKVDRLSKVLDATAQASYDLLTDVRKDVKQVDAKLDKHLLIPHAA